MTRALLLAALCSSCAILDGVSGGSSDGGPDAGRDASHWRWHGPAQVDSNGPTSADAPWLIRTPTGYLTVFYEWNVQQTKGIGWYSLFDGTSWGTPIALTAPAPFRNVFYPQATMSGSAPILLLGVDDGQAQPVRSVWSSFATAAPVRLDATGSRTPQLSQARSIASDAAGNVLAAWGEDQGVYATASADGMAWGLPAMQLDANTASSWASVNVAAGSAGHAMLAWSVSSAIMAQPIDISGGVLSPGAKHTLATGTNLRGPLLAYRGNRAMLAWAGSEGIDVATYDGNWSGTTTVRDRLDVYREAALAMNDEGKAVLVWRHYVESGSAFDGTLYGAFYDGSTWSAPAPVGLQGATRRAWWVDVDINNDGQAVAAWADWDEGGTFTRIWASVLEFGQGDATWGAAEPIDVASPDAGLADQPQNVRYCRVAMNPAGGAMVLWIQHDATGPATHVWFNRLGP